MEETLFTSPHIVSSKSEEISWAGESIELFLHDRRKIAGKFLSFDVVQERIEIQLEVRDKSATVLSGWMK